MDLFIPDYWVWKDFEAQEQNNEVYFFNLKSFEGIFLQGYKAMYSVESRGHTFLRNVCWLSTDYMTLYRSKQNTPQALLR
jgi:hypothetical protein